MLKSNLHKKIAQFRSSVKKQNEILSFYKRKNINLNVSYCHIVILPLIFINFFNQLYYIITILT